MPEYLPTAPYKGTRDFLPAEMSVRTQVFGHLYEVLESYGFLRYDGPVLEQAEIYERKSGQEIAADIVVTATGLQLLALGGVQLTVDGRDVELPETMAYRSLMLSGVPNFALTIGYTNASWTLKADLTSEYVCRLLRYMDRRGYDVCVPVQDDPGVAERPLLDFAAGYILRSMHEFPKSGSRPPWRLGMSYLNDVITLRHGRINDGVLQFSRRGAGVARAPRELVR